MKKSTLLLLVNESLTFRNWMANKLITHLDYPMPSATIVSLLEESRTFQDWAIDQFVDGDGKIIINNSFENLIDTTLNAVKDSLRRGNKIEAIKGLRDASKDEQIRKALLKEFSTFVLDCRRKGDEIVYKNYYSETPTREHFTLKFSRDLVEHIQDYTEPF
jgi:hypothetical protein